MKFVEFMKKPVSRIEYYAPIMASIIVSGVYGAIAMNQMKKILKENEVKTKEEEEDEA